MTAPTPTSELPAATDAPAPADRLIMLERVVARARTGGLPAPSVNMHIGPNGPIVVLTLESYADAAAWMAAFGATVGEHVYRPTWADHDIRSARCGLIEWAGWSVQISGWSPVTPPPAPDCFGPHCHEPACSCACHPATEEGKTLV